MTARNSSAAGPQITPISGLVDDAADYFKTVVIPAVELACAHPASKSVALSAFILLHHTKDWARHEGLITSEADLWAHCPYANVIAEIANGGKHRVVGDRHLVADPMVVEFRLCRFGEGGYGVGPYGVENIQVKGRKLASENPTWRSVRAVLQEAVGWWTTTLDEGAASKIQVSPGASPCEAGVPERRE